MKRKKPSQFSKLAHHEYTMEGQAARADMYGGKPVIDKFELPPAAFSIAVNEIYPKLDCSKWRSTREWKMFVSGYNAAVDAARRAIKAKYNMGESEHSIFVVRGGGR